MRKRGYSKGEKAMEMILNAIMLMAGLASMAIGISDMFNEAIFTESGDFAFIMTGAVTLMVAVGITISEISSWHTQ